MLGPVVLVASATFGSYFGAVETTPQVSPTSRPVICGDRELRLSLVIPYLHQGAPNLFEILAQRPLVMGVLAEVPQALGITWPLATKYKSSNFL